MAKLAVIVVDMLKGNISADSPYRRIIPNLQRLVSSARQRDIPVIFANDSFMRGDFLFTGKMKPHCLRGTEGEQVVDELKPHDGDIVVPKRRLSAFFRTDLDITLRTLGVDTIAVCGIATPGCVLTTVFDGFSNDFSVIVLEDCCAAAQQPHHEAIVNILREMPLAPLISVMNLDEFLYSGP